MTIHISKEAESTLRQAFGDSLDLEATQALAIEAYRRGKLSLGQFARVLNLDTYSADGLLKQRGVLPDMTIEEFDQELTALQNIRRK